MTNPESPPGAVPTYLLVATSIAAAVGVPAVAFATSSVAATLVLPVVFIAVIVLHAVSVRRERANHQAVAHRLRAMTVQDEVTGVNNRTGLYLLGRQMLETVRRKGDAVHAFVADTSHLTKDRKPLEGELADHVMRAVADALRGAVRGTDVVSRWNDRQFVIMGPGTGVHPGELERRVRTHLAEGTALPLDTWPCRIIVGQSSLAPWDSGDLDTLFDKAQQDYKMRRAMRSPNSADSFIAGTPKAPKAS